LERFRKLSVTTVSDDQVFFFAQYIGEIALLDASLLKYRASEVAAASLILAAKGLKKTEHTWNKELEKSTGMLDIDLQVVVEDVRSFVVEVNPKFLTTLKYKFSKAEFLEVASIPFKF
jgi:Cyclin, C-terminal domain